MFGVNHIGEAQVQGHNPLPVFAYSFTWLDAVE